MNLGFFKLGYLASSGAGLSFGKKYTKFAQQNAVGKQVARPQPNAVGNIQFERKNNPLLELIFPHEEEALDPRSRLFMERSVDDILSRDPNEVARNVPPVKSKVVFPGSIQSDVTGTVSGYPHPAWRSLTYNLYKKLKPMEAKILSDPRFSTEEKNKLRNFLELHRKSDAFDNDVNLKNELADRLISFLKDDEVREIANKIYTVSFVEVTGMNPTPDIIESLVKKRKTTGGLYTGVNQNLYPEKKGRGWRYDSAPVEYYRSMMAGTSLASPDVFLSTVHDYGLTPVFATTVTYKNSSIYDMYVFRVDSNKIPGVLASAQFLGMDADLSGRTASDDFLLHILNRPVGTPRPDPATWSSSRLRVFPIGNKYSKQNRIDLGSFVFYNGIPYFVYLRPVLPDSV